MKLRVLNVAQATVVTPDVVLIDTAREPFNALARGLKCISDRGIWLNPYRGVPEFAGIPALDILYLDRAQRIIGIDQSCRRTSISMDEMGAESSLVLPAGSAADSRMQIGDKLDFCDSVTGLLWAKRLAGIDAELIDVPAPTPIGNSVQQPIRPQSEATSTTQIPPATSNREVQNSSLPLPASKMGVWKKTLAWLFEVKPPSDRRKGVRRVVPGLVAYFWTGGPPQSHEVANISTEGFYLRTEERWVRGTTLLVSMQLCEPGSQRQPMIISVQSKVVRLDAEGVGFEYDDSISANLSRELNHSSTEEVAQLRRFVECLKE